MFRKSVLRRLFWCRTVLCRTVGGFLELKAECGTVRDFWRSIMFSFFFGFNLARTSVGFIFDARIVNGIFELVLGRCTGPCKSAQRCCQSFFLLLIHIGCIRRFLVLVLVFEVWVLGGDAATLKNIIRILQKRRYAKKIEVPTVCSSSFFFWNGKRLKWYMMVEIIQ